MNGQSYATVPRQSSFMLSSCGIILSSVDEGVAAGTSHPLPIFFKIVFSRRTALASVLEVDALASGAVGTILNAVTACTKAIRALASKSSLSSFFFCSSATMLASCFRTRATSLFSFLRLLFEVTEEHVFYVLFLKDAHTT